MGNQNSTLVNPSVAGSNLADNYSQLLSHLNQQQQSVTSPDLGAHSEIRAGMDLNQVPNQQVTSSTRTNMSLSQERNNAPSFYASSEIPMDQGNFQQETSATMPSLINMSQFRAHINSLYLSGSGSNLGQGVLDEIPMDQAHVQKTTTAPRLTLINVNQLMAHQSASGPNSGLGSRDEILMDHVHFQQTTTATMMAQQSGSGPNSSPGTGIMPMEELGGGLQIAPVGTQNMSLPPQINEAEQPHQGYGQNCPEMMDRLMMECQDYIDGNRGSFDLVYPAAPGPFREIFSMEGHEQRQFFEEIQREEEQVHQEANRQKAYLFSIVEYLLSVPNLSHEDRDHFMTMCPPVSPIELDLRMEIDEVYTKIQQIEEECTQKMADLLAIKNYVMLFINDETEFMANQTEAMQVAHLVSGVPVDAEVSDFGSEVSDFGTDAGDVGSEADDAASDVCDAGSEVGDFGSEAGEAGSDVSDTGLELGDTASEVGDVDSEAGDVGSEAADAASDVCDAGSEISDAGSDAGEAASDVCDAGSDVSDAGLDVSDTGSDLGDAGSDISNAGSEDDGIRILQSFTIVGATEPMDIAEIIDYEEMQPRCPCSPLYIEIPPLEDPEVILANAAEDWAEDAEYPEYNPFYGEDN